MPAETCLSQRRSTHIQIFDVFYRGHDPIAHARRARCPAPVGYIFIECVIVIVIAMIGTVGSDSVPSGPTLVGCMIPKSCLNCAFVFFFCLLMFGFVTVLAPVCTNEHRSRLAWHILFANSKDMATPTPRGSASSGDSENDFCVGETFGRSLRRQRVALDHLLPEWARSSWRSSRGSRRGTPCRRARKSVQRRSSSRSSRRMTSKAWTSAPRHQATRRPAT